ncbi:hypothetical protein [Mesorhizobium sp. J428]|uniref:hypothetical protein n=1 Tax=Mesorhizobium sp. J428 TaxID=2898440 RepID=UPI002151AE20|nr:hypothetical protein [Mesorhizobium sp. J428]MCR5859760.1 hypothetical protein [Mesorhizobium sp. J428]
MKVRVRPALVLTITRDRRSLAAAIEQLIDALDRLDKDPDLEPSLGWTEHGRGVSKFDAAYDDREEENEYGRA